MEKKENNHPIAKTDESKKNSCRKRENYKGTSAKRCVWFCKDIQRPLNQKAIILLAGMIVNEKALPNEKFGGQ
jgi:hypothetical protein